jgi:hypothetical protein
MSHSSSRPLPVLLLGAVYFCSLLLVVSSHDSPYPLLGRVYSGRAGEWLSFCDAIVSLYLLIGILKRQRLTVWLILAYNAIDIVNACVNLALLPADAYARLAGDPVPMRQVEASTLAAVVFLMLLNAYLIANRRHFNNTSRYLF